MFFSGEASLSQIDLLSFCSALIKMTRGLFFFKHVQDDDEYFTAPPPPPPASSQTTMVLRKRIRRIRQGMKKYNTQLVEVKRELKSCKAKMDTQNKQVQAGAFSKARNLSETDNSNN